MDDNVTQTINHFSILMEQQNAKLDAVLEVVGIMRDELAKVPKREEFEELKQDMRVVKAAVTDMGHQVHDVDHRVTRLEAA